LNGEIKVVPVTEPAIIYHSLCIITVFEDKLGLGFEQGRPIVLRPGVHVITSVYFNFERFVTQDENFSHGTIHRYIIRSGERALAWEGNVPMILTEGIYQRVSPLFKFVRSKRIDQAVVDLKPFSVITVDEGRVGVCYDRGQLSVLLPGEHWLNAEKNQKFLSFLPTTQQVKGLKTLEVLTTDGLLVRIKGSITFRIQDPHTAIINIGSSDTDLSSDLTTTIFCTIMHRANDTLASILTGTDILSTAGMGFASSSIMTKANKGEPGVQETNEVDDLKDEKNEDGLPEDSANDVGDVIRHRFKESLTATLRQEWGVELRDMNVIDVQVMDKSVRDALAEGVRCNIVAVTDRRTAESKAETARILAAGQRDASKFATDGDTYAVTELANAQKKAGQLLETTPVAVQLRLAETAASALGSTKSTMIVTQAADAQSLLRLIDSSKRAMGEAVSTSRGPHLE
jgi:regulator of protease activity HflC (stomatin/prohibitin superfamily)